MIGFGLRECENRSPRGKILPGHVSNLKSCEMMSIFAKITKNHENYINRPGQARPGQARPGQAMPGQARPGQARSGQARSLGFWSVVCQFKSQVTWLLVCRVPVEKPSHVALGLSRASSKAKSLGFWSVVCQFKSRVIWLLDTHCLKTLIVHCAVLEASKDQASTRSMMTYKIRFMSICLHIHYNNTNECFCDAIPNSCDPVVMLL